MNIINHTVLIWKGPKFNSYNDQEAFFNWTQKNECIEKIVESDDELHFYIVGDDLHDHDLRDLLALFYRYRISMTQLQRFLNDTNRAWFAKEQSYWYDAVFNQEKREGFLL